jgi:transposase
MNTSLVPDELWPIIAPLLPRERPKPRGGRPRVPDRAALGGILFVLRSGIPWEMLPPQLGCGAGMTCWRRLRDWQHAGVWRRLQRELLRRLSDADQLDWSRASIDSASIAAKKGGRRPARIQRIAAEAAGHRARSAMLWSTPRAFPSPTSSRPPT